MTSRELRLAGQVAKTHMKDPITQPVEASAGVAGIVGMKTILTMAMAGIYWTSVQPYSDALKSHSREVDINVYDLTDGETEAQNLNQVPQITH